MRTHRTWLLFALFAAVACSGSGDHDLETAAPDGKADDVGGADSGVYGQPDAGPSGGQPDAGSAEAPTYVEDVQPLLEGKCAGCHEPGGMAGVPFVTDYDVVLEAGSSGSCGDLLVYECMLMRVQEGEMPLFAGCSGDPVEDAANPACLDEAEQELLAAWVEAGAPEGEPPPPTYSADVQPLLEERCAGCHESGGIAGVPFVTDYDAAVQPGSPGSCGDQLVYECMLERIQNGSMPLGAGCSGDPGEDQDNPNCLGEAEQGLLEAWVEAGAPL